MRSTFLILIVLLNVGCAGTSSKRPLGAPAPSKETPIVHDRPSLSERQRVNKQREAEAEMVGLTKVRGDVTR